MTRRQLGRPSPRPPKCTTREPSAPRRGTRSVAREEVPGPAGLAGLVIDDRILALGTRLIFWSLLSGWTIFGPIGAAMALMTWPDVLGFGWVVIACFSAVLRERSAPISVVVAAESDT